ncbi:acyltransferase family protein [Rhizobium sp. NPDC090275]|uniref:acyltransferase family protein n=1 Tax=Rhizobium sp. NPDC090275 TaxID=3364498 RepID=UPI000DE06187
MEGIVLGDRIQLLYLPRLDGLRAVAVAGVLFEHFAPTHLVTLSPGGAGVTLFFVLSGYLITRILVNYDGFTPKSAAVHFYWRRFLRLSPPFFSALLVALILGLPHIRENIWIHSLYLTNFKIGLSGWGTGADHFWSLCTEEQFYLLWFILIVSLCPTRIVGLFLGCAAITLLFRGMVYFHGMPPTLTVLFPGNLVSLATGALMVEIERRKDLNWLWTELKARRTLIITTVIFTALSATLTLVRFPNALFYPFVASTWSASIIALAVNPSQSSLLDWLKLKPLRYLGKISYGIFVYHMFLPAILARIPFLQFATERSWLAFAVLVTLSIAIAHLSWKYLEEPIARYKDHFKLVPVVRAGAQKPAAVAAE